MSFYDELMKYSTQEVDQLARSATPGQVETVLSKRQPDPHDLPVLLSGVAGGYLEEMAGKAHEITVRNFGRVIFLFTPLYVSNYCDNTCKYCSFAKPLSIARKHLGTEEIRREAETIGSTGMRHVLLLTGESRDRAGVDYLSDAVEILAGSFSSIGIEVYPMNELEYGRLIGAGVDSLTIYQEVYDESVYHELHAGGPKQNYRYRLEAPERACAGGIHAVTVGALLGLHDWREEAFRTAVHARYLQDMFPGTEVSVSLPRMRPLVADFPVPSPVSDRQFVQLLTALRILFPTAGITVSTRENGDFRNSILPLGVTKMSAGVSTAVGGHTGEPSTTQFEIADTRSLDQMKVDLLARGYQPVMHDWHTKLVAG